MRLTEHYVTLTKETELKKKYYDEVVDILNYSYSSIGGPQSNSINKLMDPNIMWKLVTRNGKVVAVMISKLIGGTRKGVLGGCDGSEQGRKDFRAIVKEEIEQLDRKSWIEVSGKMEHIYKNRGATPIPDDIASELMHLLGKKIYPTGDGYHYTRTMGANNDEHEKIIMGNEETIKSFINMMKNKSMREGVSDMSDERSIKLAKRLLESKGYKITKKMSEAIEDHIGWDYMINPPRYEQEINEGEYTLTIYIPQKEGYAWDVDIKDEDGEILDGGYGETFEEAEEIADQLLSTYVD